jgi:hypothetical protein
MGRGAELALEIGNLALEGGMLPRILFRETVQVITQFFVLPEQNEGDKGGGDRQNCEKHKNQLNKGHGISLGCVIVVLMLERRGMRILQFVSRTTLAVTSTEITAVK